MCWRRIWNSATNIFVQPRNQHSEFCLWVAVGGPAVQQNATLEPATFEVRHEISSNFSAFCLLNARLVGGEVAKAAVLPLTLSV